MREAPDPKSVVGSIVKASRLLELFSLDRRDISLNEFAAETGYNKTTAYRLLQTLVTAGWLVRSASGGYRLGARLLVLGAIAQADLDLRSEALPYMRSLSDEFGDTAFLMVPGPHGAVTVEATVGGNPVRVHGVGVGTILPYYVAAGPVVLAAFSPSLEAEVLADNRRRFTKNTKITKADLSAKFAEVRAAGYAFSYEDFAEDIAAVAAPIFGPDGEPIASLSIGGPANHFVEPVLSEMIDRVRTAAQKLSAVLSVG
jgi:DNA-binding IclR family transcriptional regulator